MASCSTTSATMVSRQRDKIYLIGYMSHQITGCKLPSNGQVLRSLFYNMRQVKKTLAEAALLTVKEVLLFWDKGKIPTRQSNHCVKKLEKLYDEWRKLQKNANRPSASQNKKEEAFKSALDDLFDVAHQDALQDICEEDKQFLLQQREKGRPGCMAGVDLRLVRREERRQNRIAALQSARLANLNKAVSLCFSFDFIVCIYSYSLPKGIFLMTVFFHIFKGRGSRSSRNGNFWVRREHELDV